MQKQMKKLSLSLLTLCTMWIGACGDASTGPNFSNIDEVTAEKLTHSGGTWEMSDASDASYLADLAANSGIPEGSPTGLRAGGEKHTFEFFTNEGGLTSVFYKVNGPAGDLIVDCNAQISLSGNQMTIPGNGYWIVKTNTAVNRTYCDLETLTLTVAVSKDYLVIHGSELMYMESTPEKNQDMVFKRR